jgi:hypothetical protein
MFILSTRIFGQVPDVQIPPNRNKAPADVPVDPAIVFMQEIRDSEEVVRGWTSIR